MKNILVLFLVFAGLAAQAQMADTDARPNITVKWAPAALLLGSASLQAEYNFGGRNSLTAKIGLPVNACHTLAFDGNDADFNLKGMSFLAGYRTYFSNKHLSGLYYEPFFQYVHHAADGAGTGMVSSRQAAFNFTNDYNSVGVGVQLGAQFFIGRHLLIDLFFLGPQVSSASNTFKAIEMGNNQQWTDSDAAAVEQDVRDFVGKFPFVRNRTSFMTDKENKRLFANFKGALPGLRTGISVGFAF